MGMEIATDRTRARVTRFQHQHAPWTVAGPFPIAGSSAGMDTTDRHRDGKQQPDPAFRAYLRNLVGRAGKYAFGFGSVNSHTGSRAPLHENPVHYSLCRRPMAKR